MEKAAERGQGIIPGVELGGEFPVKDMATGEGGILQVCMEGVGLLFADSKVSNRLNACRSNNDIYYIVIIIMRFYYYYIIIIQNFNIILLLLILL